MKSLSLIKFSCTINICGSVIQKLKALRQGYSCTDHNTLYTCTETVGMDCITLFFSFFLLSMYLSMKTDWTCNNSIQRSFFCWCTISFPLSLILSLRPLPGASSKERKKIRQQNELLCAFLKSLRGKLDQ